MLDDQAVSQAERKESLIAYAAYKTTAVLSPGRISAPVQTVRRCAVPGVPSDAVAPSA